MAIDILKRPYERNWSGNPIHYTLFSAAAEADATIYFEIRLMVRRQDAGAYSEAIVLPYRPVDGTAKIDVQDLLDGLLEYELPTMPATNEYLSVLLASKMTGFFYIDFREITTAEPDPEWETDDENPLFVAKGGISFIKWRGDNYWVNYYDIIKPFLGWEHNNALHALTERMYLAWMNLTDYSPSIIKMKRTAMFTDGTSDVAYLDFTVPHWLVGYFPSGADQLELAAIDPAKNIYWWELQVVRYDINPLEPLSEAFRYYADNRNDYNTITLNYRGSLGNIGSARVRGVIDYTGNRSFTESERVVLHNYFEDHFIDGRIGAENSSEIQVLKGDLGYLSKEQQDRLRDINFRREVWWEQQLKWLPVQLLTASNRIRLTTDKLFSMPIEFCIAAGEEFFYTPESVNLAEAAVVAGLVCTATFDSLASEYIPGTGWKITWNLLTGAPVKWHLTTPAVSGGTPQETTTEEYTFPWLPVGDSVITVKPVCLIGGLYYFGASQTITVTVEAACVDVGISGAPVLLPDAVETIPYSFVINLTGTAPFTLDNIVKPAWMSIAVVGNTVEITGTPGLSDAGTDIEVSFDVLNCSAGTISFSDTIDVQDFAGNGEFKATNELEGLNILSWVKVLGAIFYTISTGSIPVVAESQAAGSLTAVVTDPVSVKVTSTISARLELYKNGILQETIFTTGGGVYSFAAVSYLLTDDMEVKYTT